MIKVTVIRSLWTGKDVLGDPWADSQLLIAKDDEHAGHRCCLGFACKAIGVRDKEIVDVAFPYAIVLKRTIIPRKITAFIKKCEITLSRSDVGRYVSNKICNCNTDLYNLIGQINDRNEGLTLLQKETILTRLFKDYLDMELEFVDSEV